MHFLLTIKATGNQWSGRGSARSKYRTMPDAEAALQDYVLRNWSYEMDGEPLPKDSSDRVTQYFDEVEEKYEIIRT